MPPLTIDTDADGLLDSEEDVNGNGIWDIGVETDPLNSDTDGDGVIDGSDAFPLDPDQSGGVAGDVDGDGGTDIRDLLLLQRGITGGITGEFTLDPQQQIRADMYPIGSGDGVLTVSDLIELEKAVLSP